MARHNTPNPVNLADYTPPTYLVDRVDLRVSLDEDKTRVVARMSLRQNPQSSGVDLVLDGRRLELKRILKNGRRLAEEAYELSDDHLILRDPGARFDLEIETLIHPENNLSLEGLYKSGGNFCTQCEAEGFRKITFYPDRPDVLARFTTTIEASKARYPVLLSNGNPVDSGELENGRHWALWDDPFPKPSYLFALVAGKLAYIEDQYLTASGRKVRLRIYVEEHNIDKCGHAMSALKAAMRWDEQRFGREYDLDIYMIVAVDDFNMGAMENKGLNIFNSRFVLARPESATDRDFMNIESVVAHEYFHNWTGNRVTCRDWFQLTLKEGLTVFRDQEFSADINSRALKRIQDVDVLRDRQFTEDAGPMAHAIQPNSYLEINNFYTPTVYNKGAEVIRMIHTLLGEKGFRRGMDLYFASHDGEAVTTEDFLRAMEDATGVQLAQFRRWYTQAGTPQLIVQSEYVAEEKCLHLTLRQSCPPTPGQKDKEPFHIPVRIGLLDRDGRELPLRLEGEDRPAGTKRVLELTQAEQTFRFSDIGSAPVASVLRDFSAPVRLAFEQDDEELAFLMAHDPDPFNRWDAGQRLATKIMLGWLSAGTQAQRRAPEMYIGALAKTLADPALDPALVAMTLVVPSEQLLSGMLDVIDVEGIHNTREAMSDQIARRLRDQLLEAYQRAGSINAGDTGAPAIGRRSLANACLGYLVVGGRNEDRQLAVEQFSGAVNMTNQLAALTALVHVGCPEAELALAQFAEQWSGNRLVMDKWFALQASAPLDQTPERVSELLQHPLFNLHNPNRARALLGAFGEANPYCFHSRDGRGYRIIAEQVMKLNEPNPSVAARLLEPLTRWRRYDDERQTLMKAELSRIAELAQLSRNLYELVRRSLDEADD